MTSAKSACLLAASVLAWTAWMAGHGHAADGPAIRENPFAPAGRAPIPRPRPPKPPLHVPPGERLLLTVGFAESLAARPGPGGRLAVNPAASTALADLVASSRLRFRRLHTVPDSALAALAERAAAATGRSQPDFAGHLQIETAGATRANVLAMARRLHALDDVEFVEVISLDRPPPPPATDIPPVTPLLVSQQTYRTSTGIGSDHIWDTHGIRGDPGLAVTDCEYNYNPVHEDLAGLVTEQPGVLSRYTAFGNNHGTAVLGILASGWNAYGTTGIVPECRARFYPDNAQLVTGFQSRTACVTAAIANSAPGDIVILEMQTDGPASGTSDYVPAEYVLSVWNAVKAGTDAGVAVVAAAGNGNQNLDAALFDSYRARGDSGAIIVGAGSSARAKLSFSTYGARVNIQAWGQSVVTTGYGTLARYGSDDNQAYANGFSGTSSATAIAGAATALLQSASIKLLGTRRTPAQLRHLLASTGRAQTGSNASTARIGPLPDLAAATAALLAAHPPSFATWSQWGHYHFATPAPDPGGDLDRDGIPALLEYVLGTDPKSHPASDAAKLPKLTPAPGGSLVFEFAQPAARTGATWKIQTAPSLDPHVWADLVHGAGGVSITRHGDTIRASIPAPPSPAYFRLCVSL